MSANVAKATLEQNPPDFSPQGAGVPAVLPMSGVERVFGAQLVQVYRDEAKVLQKLKVVAAAAGTDWYYRFPVRNNQTNTTDWIEGPSIKLANELARLFGNCDLDVRVQDQGDSWLFHARFIDLETGFSLQRPYQQRKAQGSMRTKDPGRAQDIAFQIGCSKAQRNVVVHALQTFADFAFDEARNALVSKVGSDLERWRQRTIDGINNMKIDVKRVELVIGRSAKDWLAPDVARVIAMMKGIAEGMATASETFPDPNRPEQKPDEGALPQTVAETLDQFGAGASGGAEGEPPGATTHDADSTGQEPADRTSVGDVASGGALPTDPASYEKHARAIIDAAQDRESASRLESWWGSDAERKLRNACHVAMPMFNQIKELVAQKAAQYGGKKK